MPDKYDYDAIIIGAGISGLVCGCYLAKAGLKTLIVEKNPKPGGYCTSFTRNGFYFDACAHSLGSLRKDGIVARALQELEISEKIKITRYDPQDIIITPDYKICFWNNLNKTIQGLQNNFPKERENIKKFFDYLDNSRGISNAVLRNKTLKDIMDAFLKDDKLKSILSLLVLGNVGLPSSTVSAFTAVTFYKEFLIDGGYYPDGGMQVFSDALAKRFKELGGRLLLSDLVTDIKIRDNTVEGVITEKNNFISSKYVISNCDVMQTFFSLVGQKINDKEIIKKLTLLIPSLSMFILYLGIKNWKGLPSGGTNIWFLPNYYSEKMYTTGIGRLAGDSTWFMVRIMPAENSIIAFMNAPFKDETYWYKRKNEILNAFIQKVEIAIPGLSEYIVYKDAATPYTLYKRTLNYKGAAYGWASMPSQFAIPGLSQTTPIKNLYLTGHWTTLAQGIPGVVYLGRDTAKIISRKERNKT